MIGFQPDSWNVGIGKLYLGGFAHIDIVCSSKLVQICYSCQLFIKLGD